MSSIAIARTNYKRSCDTFATTNTNNLAFTNNELTIHGNSYANTPSPSSTTSSNITEHSTKRSKNNTNNYMFSKLRYRHEKLIQCTDSLTRHYILTSTNIIFQMQKQINKLKRRTLHLEQKLARQAQSTHPIIRIPRLTKDEISSICVNNHETSSDKQITNVKGTDEELNPNENPTNKSEPLLVITKGKFCPACRHEFSHRSGYLRHMRRMHKVDATTSDATNHNEINETVVIADQPETDNEIEGDNAQILVNQWDIGEGRLRPRRVSKSYKEAFAKIKCNLCNKFFREDYIEKHVRRVHQTPRPTNPPDDLISPTTESVIDNQTHPADMSPLETVADMNINDTAVEFQDKSVKQIVLATTCLDTHQLEIVDEFVQAFGSHISQTTNVDSRTTHLIANDDKNLLCSPVSLKLIEGIAHHCFCVSYRWLIDCLKYDQLIDEYPYEIDSDDSGSHAHGGPRRSRLSDKNHGLFDGYCFMIKCTQKSDIYISNDRLQQLIQSCGGMIITCVTQAYLEQYKIVVLCDRLYVSERRHNYDQCRSLKINFLSSNWVLESILEYRLKPMESYLEKPL